MKINHFGRDNIDKWTTVFNDNINNFQSKSGQYTLIDEINWPCVQYRRYSLDSFANDHIEMTMW